MKPFNVICKACLRKVFFAGCLSLLISANLFSQFDGKVFIASAAENVKPFDKLNIVCRAAGTIVVKDGAGRAYISMKALPTQSFLVGGAAGKQTILLIDKKEKIIGSSTFILEANTNIDDGGRITSLFNMLKNGMVNEDGKPYHDFYWKDSSYKFYVPWDLDNNNVMNGIQYFYPYGNGLTDLLRKNTTGRWNDLEFCSKRQ